MTVRDGALVLADGSVFEGELIGAEAPIATGEVVFNTVLSGYQEVITDPSYAGQIITFTTPHIGNYGVNAADFESRGTFCRGIVVRELARRHSNQRAEASLDAHAAPARRARHRRHRHPPSHPHPARHRRHAGRVRIGERDRTPRCCRGRAGHRWRRPGAPGHRSPRATPSRRSTPTTARASSPIDFGMKRNIAVNLSRYGTRRGGAGDHERRRHPGPRRRRRLPQQRPRRPGDGASTASRRSRDCSATCRSSGSASATSCSVGRSAPAR